ncbi:MAG: aldo/keto reductase [Candidatus Bathyarchaeota archaeon]|nr:aldo/keto reductase [Candidatus Bathyarchaeota archaeon]
MIEMIRIQPFGSTEHNSSATIFGAAALSRVTQDVADETLNLLDRYGVNHIDVAASYGDAELRIGPWMERRRGDFFLATKTEMRNYTDAKTGFQKSLRRLRVKGVDLIQLHNLTHPDEWEAAMGVDGALKALKEAKEQGLTRFIGVTGHGLFAPSMHMKSLKKYDFDSVLLPWNYVLYKDERYRREFNSLLKTCRDKGVAVQTIKSLTRGPWGEKRHTAETWYEPFEEQKDINLAVSWVLGQGTIFLNTTGDVRLLPKALEAASLNAPKPIDAEMEDLFKRTHMSRLFVG